MARIQRNKPEKPEKKVRFEEHQSSTEVDPPQPEYPSHQSGASYMNDKGNYKDPAFAAADPVAMDDSVSQQAILAQKEMKVSSHDSEKHNILEFENETPAEDLVSQDGDEAILAAWSSTPYSEEE